jgi:prepilin-type N-terminal cleavage/methylation domain-containing protein
MNMKTNVEGRESRVKREAGNVDCAPTFQRLNTSPFCRAFTLIEVLVVIAVIAVIAALILPVAGAVKREAFIHTAQAEMSQIQTAIERYHSAYGFYPPDNPGAQPPINNPYCALTNQLYFELVGTTNSNGGFQTVDNSAQVSVSDATTWFGVSGFMNCTKTNADESAMHGQDFLPDLKPNQIATLYTNGPDVEKILVTSDGGPDPDYKPFGPNYPDVNPWRYLNPGVNNPGSYDLWVQLKMAGKTNLICNWSSQVQINSSLP